MRRMRRISKTRYGALKTTHFKKLSLFQDDLSLQLSTIKVATLVKFRSAKRTQFNTTKAIK